MKNKKVVVTGGAGFIGSHLAEELVENNEVIVIDNLSTGKLENIKHLMDNEKIIFKKGDIRDLDFLKKEFEGADYIFHQAAIVSVPFSIKNPFLTNEVNVSGTLNVLMAAKENSVKKVVYASSCAVYGNNPNLPLKEEMLPMPLSPYAVSKLTGEYYCQVFTDMYGLPAISLRYFNVYGPRQDASSPYAAVVPKFIERVKNNKPPIIYGDGKQTRDFIYVKDIVRANIMAAESMATGIFNIASGKAISIEELAYKIIEIARKNKNIKPLYEKPSPGDVRYSMADITKARKELNFRPEYSLKEGLKEVNEMMKL
ncbi:MAG: SDR family oxidoreductase [Thermoplasmata archaeon]|nr:SDR family oxidoreductase [Thermoplasmata archaeon]